MWQIEISRDAGLSLNKLHRELQEQILDDLHNFIQPIIRQHRNNINHRTDFWPFRSGSQRILCRINQRQKVIEIIEIKPM